MTQDAVIVAPEIYRVLLENDRVTTGFEYTASRDRCSVSPYRKTQPLRPLRDPQRESKVGVPVDQ